MKNIKQLIGIMENYKYSKPNDPVWNTYENMCVMYMENIIKTKQNMAEMLNFMNLSCKIYLFLNKISFGKCYKNNVY